MFWLPCTETVSATKRRAEGLRRAEGGGGSAAAEVMVVEQPETLFQRRWKQLRQRFGGSPMFKRLEASRASATLATQGICVGRDETWSGCLRAGIFAVTCELRSLFRAEFADPEGDATARAMQSGTSSSDPDGAGRAWSVDSTAFIRPQDPQPGC